MGFDEGEAEIEKYTCSWVKSLKAVFAIAILKYDASNSTLAKSNLQLLLS